MRAYVSRENSRTNPPSSGDDSFRIALNGAKQQILTTPNARAHQLHNPRRRLYCTLSEIKYDAKRTTDLVRGFGNSPTYNTTFSQSFDSAPSVFVLTQLEMDGGDGGWIVNYSVSQIQAGLMINDDQENDSDRSDANETCGFLSFEAAGTYH